MKKILYLFIFLISTNALAECRPFSFIQAAELAQSTAAYEAIPQAQCSEKPSELCLCADFPMLFVKISSNGTGISIEHDLVKNAAFDAAQSQSEAIAGAMNQARKAQACGKDTMAYLLVRNAQKNLTTEQVKNLINAYQTIKSLLESGSLATAKEEIANAISDGVIVTEADKAALVTFIDGCKP